MESESSANGIDLVTLLGALPACKRCRRNRRRCDTKLPSCAKCTKAGVECIYYDHVLQEELPRSYIASLIDHLERDGDPQGAPSAWAPSSVQGMGRSSNNPENRQHYFAFSRGAYRYLGAQSPLLDHHWREGASLTKELPKRKTLEFPSLAATDEGLIAPDLRRYLVQLFFDSVHQIYPILDSSLPWLSPDASMIDLHPPPTQSFILHMVCAVACHCDDEHRSTLVPLATAAHGRALKYIEKATAEQSISTLQVATLLVLYTLFHPASGNVSQQLGFAIRLAIDLVGSDSDEEPSVLASLHQIIYCLENHVCGVLVRPTSLPEPSTPLTVSSEEPLEFLCTLYRAQSRIRNRTIDGSLSDAILTIPETSMAKLHPNIVATLWETRLMLEPTASVAIRLVFAYMQNEFIATFLTAHWVQRAANLIIGAVSTAEGTLRSELMMGYGNAVALLGKWAGSWEGAGIVLKSLQARLKEEGDRTNGSQLPS